MADINNVNLTGRLTKDPNMNTTATGMAITKVSIAVNEYVKKDKEERPNFFDLTLFGKQAEFVKNYISKGDLVSISGSLRQERWRNKEGDNRNKVVINVDKIVKMSVIKANTQEENTNNNDDFWG